MKKNTTRPSDRTSTKPSRSTPVPAELSGRTGSASIGPSSSLLTNIRYGLFLASLLTPLIYSSTTYFGYISERTWYINALIESLFLVAVFTPGFFVARLSRLQLAVLLFLAILFVADGLGVDPIQSFFSGYARMEGFLLYLHLGLYFFALVRVPFPKPYWNGALLLVVIIAVFVTVKGYVSSTGWQAIDHRLIATVGNPSFLSVYLLLPIFISLYLYGQFPTVSRLIKGTMVGISLCVLTGGIYLTGTRSAIIGLASGCIYLVTISLWSRYQTFSKRIGWLVLMVAVVSTLFWVARNNPLLQKFPIMYRLTHYSGDNNTLSPRFICWKIGLHGVTERPLLGWGRRILAMVLPRTTIRPFCSVAVIAGTTGLTMC
ncbi:hypothetical protein GO730_04965 [Spirosoma sp. HMF3257]|uniref:O-antigen ligase-related domain-containing protein n=1 Tax=Spirosoma telluris TaxID=2183553 RepID=A0A327NHV8_9BACT|nr:hypothetical protein [Spirosoma telluris]RAI73889.1 hypothetical protein HMF3257_04935 [Spirosoma telluris]